MKLPDPDPLLRLACEICLEHGWPMPIRNSRAVVSIGSTADWSISTSMPRWNKRASLADLDNDNFFNHS